MSVPLNDAVERLIARKGEVLVAKGDAYGAVAPLADTASVYHDLNLDTDELAQCAHSWAIACLSDISNGHTEILHALAGMWIDGVLTGLLAARMAEEGEA